MAILHVQRNISYNLFDFDSYVFVLVQVATALICINEDVYCIRAADIYNCEDFALYADLCSYREPAASTIAVFKILAG